MSYIPFNKTVDQVELAAVPAELDHCFDVLRETDPEAPFALFGGAVRDADYLACHSEGAAVNDYDLRIWLPGDEYKERVREFVGRLGVVAETVVHEVRSAGMSHIRYCLSYLGAEMDVSIRPTEEGPISVASVAIERAGEADIGLSAVAIASDGTAWATPEYLSDRDHQTLQVYPRLNSERRLKEYTQRMKRKFPHHRVVWL